MRKILFVFFSFVFAVGAANACTSDEIDVLGDGTQCETAKFTVTTTDLDTNTEFKFYMSAKGTFYVDWGDGNTEKIERTNTAGTVYSHTYTTGGINTIRFGGVATGYWYGNSAISFYKGNGATGLLVGGIGGKLGTLFPTIGDGVTATAQPAFFYAFQDCTNLTGAVPNGFFDGLYGAPVSRMFDHLFTNCSGLTGALPDNLFANITGPAVAYLFRNAFMGTKITSVGQNFIGRITAGRSVSDSGGIFEWTFRNCSALETVPVDIFNFDNVVPGVNIFNGTFAGCTKLRTLPSFSGVVGAPATSMFNGTFQGCTNLTGQIPANLFSGISGAPATSMFNSTFSGCTNLGRDSVGGTPTYGIPSGLFSGISGAPATSMFYNTFAGCTGLTGSIPSNLFSGISGAPQASMFCYTFYGCTGLTGSIPSNLFSGISGAPATSMFNSTFSGCTNLGRASVGGTPTYGIPSGLFGSISGAPAERMFSGTFNGCTGLTGPIPSGLFGTLNGTPAPYMFNGTFSGCSNLTGSIPSGLFGNLTGAPATSMFYNTFGGCRGLSGYVSKDIFENITASGQTSYMFNNTNLYTTAQGCPCGTKPATTGWGDSTVNGKIICEVGLKSNEHFNNEICTTDCAIGFSRLKTSTGLDYPILSDLTSEHSIYLKTPDNTVCYVPLVSGAANNAINVSLNGVTYHASVPDETIPPGYTGQPE